MAAAVGLSTIEKFEAAYRPALVAAMVAHPEDYQALQVPAETVVLRMIAAIQKGGIGAVNINSHSFKALAKQFGIKNTYKAWREWGLA